MFIDPPGLEWNDFVHSTNELVTVVEGKLRMNIEGEEVIAEPGDEVFIPKKTLSFSKNYPSRDD
ncbi:MAG: cupin domain-containing protein [Nitrospirales bacterium]|nr:cupin domain-containing protein [Nitrospirales bacterium]